MKTGDYVILNTSIDCIEYIKIKTCDVYWIHLEEHTDITKEGYIGISINVKVRWLKHKNEAKKGNGYIIGAAIRKYGSKCIFTKLLTSTLSYCLNVEKQLRPFDIGWNATKGGGSTPDCTGNSHSEETKRKISSGNKGKNKNKPSVLKGLTNRFTTEQMERMVTTRRANDNYRQTEETKRKISKATSGSKSHAAKSIIIRYKTEIPKVFNSIKEAAIELNINYSGIRARLRGKCTKFFRDYSVDYYIGTE